ncbi:MAG TPA: helix-turn-helix domain-containing protein [Anaerolineales bacterium]|nr:helix-turn-helix domain-containing protein [Anaerolineales bacterium]
MTIKALPLTFRSDLIQLIHKHLEAGKCGALIGVASSGKSRLVEFMGRPDARECYLGEAWPRTLFPWVDGNDLLEYSEWGLCEKILSAVLVELDRLPNGADMRRAVTPWYWKLTQLENRHLARRLVGFALAELKDIRRIVLLLDDFEHFIAHADDAVFRGLRALRDAFKHDHEYRLLYLLFSRHQPVVLRETISPDYESFLELFKNFTHPIGCYSREDALFMIERLSEAYPLNRRTMTLELAEQLYRVTGGHAGLMDAAFHSKTEAAWGQGDLARVLINAAGVWNECDSIWGGLDDDERSVLMAVVNGRDPGGAATRWLEATGLISRDTDSAPQVIELARLFLAALASQPPEIQPDEQRRALNVEGCVVELTEREFALAQALWKARGNWKPYAELYRAVYPGRPEADTLILDVREIGRRVVAKVRRACAGRSIIFNDPERGFRMV